MSEEEDDDTIEMSSTNESGLAKLYKPLDKMKSYFFMFVPLAFDRFFDNENHICPNNNCKIYSILMLLSPTISFLLIAVALGFQHIYRKSEKFVILDVIINMFPNIVLMGVLTLLTLGASFLKGDNFACYKTGPIPFNATDTDLNFYEIEFENQVAISRFVGWGLIWSSLIMLFAGILFYYFVTKPSEYDRLFKEFNRIKKEESKKIFETEIRKIAREMCLQDIAGLIRNTGDCECTLKEALIFIDQYVETERKRQQINKRICQRSTSRKLLQEKKLGRTISQLIDSITDDL